ncbi:HlyD family efflux transporter periplasmic adaptor subunit [Demequina subtropica]|uniref:HlyD family efflux transporter periplasmic adaptor subunit n=1 Tax=Demequina subtropica TaxID=1638989 RepID=UPI0007824C8F|nr:HlyD family efflux transporter periplasmic adaptor subunit [Demequina subtropica]
MSWINRMRFGLGLVGVLLIGLVGTVIFNQREHRVDSISASIHAIEHPVGTDYGGLVSELHVAVGDVVAIGDPLLVITSTALERDLAEGLLTAGRGGISKDGTLTVRASVPGIVTALPVGQGSYAWQGSPVATISEMNTLYVQADYLVSTLDFGRITDVAQVDIRLPDSTVLTGQVSAMDVEEAGDQSLVTIRVASDELAWGSADDLVEPGTPVLTTLHLRDDGILAGPGDMLSSLAHRIGL